MPAAGGGGRGGEKVKHWMPNDIYMLDKQQKVHLAKAHVCSICDVLVVKHQWFI